MQVVSGLKQAETSMRRFCQSHGSDVLREARNMGNSGGDSPIQRIGYPKTTWNGMIPRPTISILRSKSRIFRSKKDEKRMWIPNLWVLSFALWEAFLGFQTSSTSLRCSPLLPERGSSHPFAVVMSVNPSDFRSVPISLRASLNLFTPKILHLHNSYDIMINII